jgi:hypothetical protein
MALGRTLKYGTYTGYRQYSSVTLKNSAQHADITGCECGEAQGEPPIYLTYSKGE